MKGYYDNSLNLRKGLYAKLPENYVRPFTNNANLCSYSFRYNYDILGNI